MKKLKFKMMAWGVFFTICTGALPLTHGMGRNRQVQAPSPPEETTLQPGTKKALVYRGPGACEDGCAQAAFEMALRSGLDPVYVSPTALTSASTELDKQSLFKDVAVWIQPGGKSTTVLNSMTLVLVKALREFVAAGGGYVGFCAGAFSSTTIVGTSSVTGFGLLEGRTKLFSHYASADVIPIQWGDQKRYIYWEGGPYHFDLPAGKVETRATYANGQIASVRSTYGLGRIYVTGLHPEAPQSWRSYYGLDDQDGLDYDLVDEMIQWARKH